MPTIRATIDQRIRAAPREESGAVRRPPIWPTTPSTTRWRRTARPRSASSTGSRPPSRPRSGRSAADIVALAKSQGANFQPTAADWNFYAEQIRKQRYALDSDELKPYFEFNKVLEDGVFYAANQLYGLTFKERKDIPTWSPDMRVFQVYDADGKELAIFMIDPWKRDNKSAARGCRTSSTSRTCAAPSRSCSTSRTSPSPRPGQPALISWDDVTTMFHEFGHALHGMFAAQTYPTLSGTNVARDFVEFPSQFNENWALDPKILPHYAVNYKTGQPIPQELVDKIKRSRTFNQGYEVGEVLEAARLDLDWHSLPATRRGRMSTSSRRMRSRRAASTPPTCRRATARAISSTSGATAIRRAIMPIPGRACWPGCVRLVREPTAG